MKQHSHRSCIFRILHIALGVPLAVMIWAHPAPAQNAGGAAQAAGDQRLKIVIVGGEEPLKNLKQRTSREVIVEVRDQNDRPVGAGAAVTLALSRGGNGTITAITGANGRAVLNFTPNLAGSANVNVGATLGTQTGAVAIPVNVVTAVVPAVAAAAATAAAATAGAVAQSTLATKDCGGIFDPSSLTVADQVCSAGAVSPNTSPQCMSAVQTLLTQFSQLCSCVGGISVPQLYTQYGITSSDIDLIGSQAKTVGFNLPASCLSPTAPTIIRGGPPNVGPPG